MDCTSLRSIGVPIIEDCCQCVGRKKDGTWVGTEGDVAVYSLHPTKCFTGGSGGVVATNCEKTVEKIDVLKTDQSVLFNFTDLQAALALSQFQRYGLFLQRRHDIANRYFTLLPRELTSALREINNISMFFRFPLIWPADFDETRMSFSENGIQVRRGVDTLLHRQEGTPDEYFPHAVRAFAHTLSIPILPQLTEEEVNRVVGVTIDIYNSTSSLDEKAM